MTRDGPRGTTPALASKGAGKQRRLPIPPSSLSGRYGPILATALGPLIPYIIIASAVPFYRTQIAHDLSADVSSLSVVGGLSTAGYAFGALLAGDLINRVPQHRMYFLCQCLFVAGWLAMAAAPSISVFGTGRVAVGLATGMLLVTSLPPTVRRFPPERLPFTAALINIGLFGAIAAGPVVGGFLAGWHAWRAAYFCFAAFGVGTSAVAWFALPETDPFNPDLPFDWQALALAIVATVLPFFASGALRAHGFSDAIVAIPLAVGLIAFLALIAVEYHKREPLAPIRMMWTTLPIIGTLIAMLGGGAFVTLVMLTTAYLTKVQALPPIQAGLCFLPQLVGVAAAAALLRVVFETRYLPVLAFCGMILLLVAGVMLLALSPSANGLVLYAALAILGLGAGTTVSPGLFLAGLSLPSTILGRILALVELVRSVADFIMAPVMLKVASRLSPGATASAPGILDAGTITLAVAALGLIVSAVLYLASGARLMRPDLEGWLSHERPAWDSPPLFARLRPAATDPGAKAERASPD